MKGTLPLLVAMFLLIPTASAIQTPDIKIIPENFSANATWLLVVDPKPGPDEVVRVTWSDTEFGQVPKSEGRWICLFSNSDPAANCGPNPFTESCMPDSPCALSIDVRNQRGEKANKTLNLTVGNIRFIPTIDVVKNETKKLIITTSITPRIPTVSNLSFKVYDSNLNVIESGSLNFVPDLLAYRGECNITDGRYYVTISHPFLEYEGEVYFGSTMMRKVIGYEEAEIPSIQATKPFQRMLLIKAGETKSINECCLKNMQNRSYNLSFVIPEDIRKYIDVMVTESIDSNEQLDYWVTIKDITSGMHIVSEISIQQEGENITIGSLPIDISISILNESAPIVSPEPVTVSGLSISPRSIYETCLEGDSINLTFMLNNVGNSNLQISFSQSGLSFATLPGPIILQPGNQTSINITMVPTSPGLKSGRLIFLAGNESIEVPVYLNVYEDISSDIESLRSQLNSFISNKPGYETIGAAINSSLDTALSYQDSGDYEAAAQSYYEAKGRFSALESIATATPSGPGLQFDPMIVIIIVLVLAGGVGGWFGLKWLKSRPKKEKIEKELEEEF